MKKTVLVLLVIILFPLIGCDLIKTSDTGKTVPLSLEDTKKKAEDFINKNLMQPGTTATVQSITDDGTFYKLMVDVGQGKTLPGYITKDGKKFIPEVIDMAEFAKQKAAGQDNSNKQPVAAAVAPKTDKPNVELFVMSYCPYGTQIEKGILPVLNTLGNNIQFTLKFVDYAMHGEKEVRENMLQYCIQKEDPTKLQNYLSCFLKNSDSSACLKTAKITTTKVNSCVTDTDRKYQIMQKFNDKTQWSNGSFPPFDVYKADNVKYGVQGSPTLVINGVQVESARDSQSLLKTICNSFTVEPKACKTVLSSATPAPGFGEDTTTNGTPNADCGQ
jgi:hypothetical protein